MTITSTGWPCFGRCRSAITNPNAANLEWQLDQETFESFTTIRAIHKSCHTGPDHEWLWCPGEAFAGPDGLRRAQSYASDAAAAGLDAAWIAEGVRAWRNKAPLSNNWVRTWFEEDES